MTRSVRSKPFVLAATLLLALATAQCKDALPPPVVIEPPPLPPVTVRGTVIDQDGRTPIAGATVKATAGSQTVSVTTNATGAFDFGTSLTATSGRLTATGTGYFENSVDFTVANGVAAVPQIALAKQVVATAQVTAATGGSTSATASGGAAAVSVQVSVPAGAATSNVALTVTPANPTDLPKQTGQTQVPVAGGVFGPDGTKFNTPISVSLTQPGGLEATSAAQLSVVEWNAAASRWDPARLQNGNPVTATISGNSATIGVDHFSIYALQVAGGTLTVTPGASSNLPVNVGGGGSFTQTATVSPNNTVQTLRNKLDAVTNPPANVVNAKAGLNGVTFNVPTPALPTHNCTGGQAVIYTTTWNLPVIAMTASYASGGTTQTWNLTNVATPSSPPVPTVTFTCQATGSTGG